MYSLSYILNEGDPWKIIVEKQKIFGGQKSSALSERAGFDLSKWVCFELRKFIR